MNLKLQGQTIEHYKEYANSTINLNKALNAELSICYDRVARMTKELAQSQKTNQRRCQEIQRLNEIIKSSNNHHQQSTKNNYIPLNPIVQTEFNSQQKQLKSSISSCQQNKIPNDKLLESQIQTLISAKIQLNIELQIQRLQSQNLANEVHQSKQQIKRYLRKIQQLIRQSQQQVKQLSFTKQQCQKMFEEVNFKNNQIQYQEDKILILQSQIQSLKSGTANHQVNSLQIKTKKEENNHNNFNYKMIRQLQQKIGLLQAQNKQLKETFKNIERRNSKSKQIIHPKKTEEELLSIKQQYSKVVKQNTSQVQAIGKLQKNCLLFTKQLEILRKQKIELSKKIHQLYCQLEVSNLQLEKRDCKILDLSSSLTLKQSQYYQMKKSLSTDMIKQIGMELKSPQDFPTIKKGDNTQIPVRDSSTASRSKSSFKGLPIRKNQR